MKPTVYIETTIPSYYCDDRPGLAADIARTREWWDQERGDYECGLVGSLNILDAVPEVLNIAQVYQAHKLMPGPPSIDALHVAIASYYHMDYLLTWNCQHLANVRKAEHLEQINSKLHLGLPRSSPHKFSGLWRITNDQ